ncbi:MAG TPA: DUF445 domain-containing protein [Porticoccaceae bacterium]|nr:DUF445 domain-containing protein [Gammaproteobacteria bacterium]HIL61583.1 DUF445 domain-containing protein [Porticoccaceae bacterium]
MNKSLVSNLIASAIIALGVTLDGPFQIYVLNTGLFALSGGVTNWLAVHMLFERVPGLYGSGVIPMRFEEFKAGIRKLIMDQFFNNSDLEDFFHGTGNTAEKLSAELKKAMGGLDLDSAFESLLDVIMTSSFGGMLGVLGGRDALDPLKTPFVGKMREYFDSQFTDSKFHEQLQAALKSALDDDAIRGKLEDLIDQRLDMMTPKMVKDIIQEMIRKHLGWLVVWGCAFGGLIGLVVTLISNL